MNVIARAVNWSAAQNHSEPGPMNAIPFVLMSVTPVSSVPLTGWAGRYRDMNRGASRDGGLGSEAATKRGHYRAFDLAIARAVRCLENRTLQLDGHGFIGELALDGSVRPVTGVLPMARCLRAAGVRRLAVAEENGAPAR